MRWVGTRDRIKDSTVLMVRLWVKALIKFGVVKTVADRGNFQLVPIKITFEIPSEILLFCSAQTPKDLFYFICILLTVLVLSFSLLSIFTFCSKMSSGVYFLNRT